mgnify:CR=1 FL=1
MTLVNRKVYYTISENVIAREIEGEMIIVPLASGVGNLDEALFSLNKTGKIIWSMLDGTMTLESIIRRLSDEYAADEDAIGKDVENLMAQLLSKGLIKEIEA